MKKVLGFASMAKYIFVTGGVVSSLGKGITAASIGLLLKSRGFSVSMQKLDPYINIDPGTMNPCQHGEVFVTEDGAETDLDLGHYERFVGVNMSKDSNVTSGKIYWDVLNREREGGYLGNTVQVIPHITNEIKRRIRQTAEMNQADFAIVEVGGTVGDIEGLPFLEAIRQMRKDKGKENTLYIHLTLLPWIKGAGELKTKPTQHSVKELRSIGIQPDILVCRTERTISGEMKKKISLFCDVDEKAVIANLTSRSIYDVPLMLNKEGLDSIVLEKLAIEEAASSSIDLSAWGKMAWKAAHPSKSVDIAIVGKYIEVKDAYISIVEALRHAGISLGASIDITWIDAEALKEGNISWAFQNVDGILVPGGFGSRGVEGKIHAVFHARTAKIPFLGICLGMQCAVIEYARHICGLFSANSTEFNSKTPYPVIDILDGHDKNEKKGGTMRLGKQKCVIKEGSISREAYEKEATEERHRHRYELNNAFRKALEAKGLVMAGENLEEPHLVEIVELPREKHPFFVGCQFHPEFKSRPVKPSPLFVEFVKAVIKQSCKGELKI